MSTPTRGIPIPAAPAASSPPRNPATGTSVRVADMGRYLNRLRRLEGQVRGIERMIDQERYCLDVLTQISAVNKALGAVALGLLEEHLRRCILDAAATGQPVSDLTVAEVAASVSLFVRS